MSLVSWASYSMSADGAGANEHDLFVSYTVASEKAGSFTVGVTDYYFPAPSGLGFFDFEGKGDGAHWVEPFVSWDGPASFPVSLMGAAFVHNDPDNSVYLQASVPQALDDVELEWSVGAVTGESAFYGTSSFSVVQAGVSVTQNVELTERFALPLTVSYIINPVAERTFLVFGLSF
ncbi:MAG: hypothetical protein OXT73_10990 [Bacteroidota bacterium]|nr:hypothetical protein [Bacteroidota bacterium]